MVAMSPELALVDPGLACDARTALPEGEDTLARLELLVRAHRILARRTRAVSHDTAGGPLRRVTLKSRSRLEGARIDSSA
jgi:hypothetical protein